MTCSNGEPAGAEPARADLPFSGPSPFHLMRLFLLPILVLMACAGEPAEPAAPLDAPPPPAPIQNDLAAGLDAEGLDALAGYVGAAGLAELLQSEGPYTVLGPTDEAFADATIAEAQLSGVLRHHVIPGRIEIEPDLLPMGVETVDGSEITFAADGDGLMVRDATGRTARITKAGVNVSNGVLHVIDAVLAGEAR